MGKISRFLRFLAIFGMFVVGANAWAAGYVCDTMMVYDSCASGYYVSDCGGSADWSGQTLTESDLSVGNTCVACPDGYNCTGGLVCPVSTGGGGDDNGGSDEPAEDMPYACSMERSYSSCTSNYYLSDCGTSSNWTGQTLTTSDLSTGNSCEPCPEGFECSGGATCPISALVTSCSSGKYLSDCGTASNWNGQTLTPDSLESGNLCLTCPDGYSCTGGLTCPTKASDESGYVCDTKRYLTCPSGQFLSDCGETSNWSGQTLSTSELSAGNACIECPEGGVCSGGATCPIIPDYKFELKTVAGTSSFDITINAAGNFVIDWGDGKVEAVINETPTYKSVPHTYATAGTYTIKIGGLATEYDVEAITQDDVPVIGFSTSKIASIDGSIGAIFPTLSNGDQPGFYSTFANSKITSLPPTLFDGVHGAGSSMFLETFSGCEALTEIPVELFSGIIGAADYMFNATFLGCEALTEIPAGLFDGLADVETLPNNMFGYTFKGCSALTGPAARMSDGTFLHDIWPMTGATMNTYTGATGLTDWDYIPSSWGGGGVTISCDGGQYLPANATACATCPAGNYCAGLTGVVPSDTDQGIEQCPAGTYCAAASTEPTACPAGYTNTAAGLEKGADCFGGYKFEIETTNSLNGTFSIAMVSVKGDFWVDWGDGSAPEYIPVTDFAAKSVSHPYTGAGKRTIRIGGLATAYNTAVTAWASGIIKFQNNPYISKLNGSLGAIFPTLSDGSQPGFFGAFMNNSNLTSISAELFSGISGQARDTMFMNTFAGCSKLTSIPAGLFSGISGAPAQGMFAGTFGGCTGLTSIPAGLFGNLDTTAPAMDGMFNNTFQGCSALTGPAARMSDGTFLHDIWPMTGSDMQTYTGATGLTDWDYIPLSWGGGGRISCAAGQYIAKGGSTCTACKPGYYCEGGDLTPSTSADVGLTQCPADSFCVAGSAEPTTCASVNDGLYPKSNAGATAATSCYLPLAPNQYVDLTAKVVKTGCPAGYFCPEANVTANTTPVDGMKGATSCKNFGDMYTSDANTVVPVAEETYGAENVANIKQKMTDAGLDASVAKFGCYANIPAGSYKSGVGSEATVELCPVNTYSEAHKSYMSIDTTEAECSACAAPYASSAQGATSRAQCYLKTDAGKYVKATAAGQVTCEKGNFCAGGTTVYYGTAGGATTGGSATCPAGSFCPAGVSAPTACSTLGGGLYKNSDAGSDEDTDCHFTTTAGTYLVTKDDTKLTDCPVADYCPATKLNWESVGGNVACPAASNHLRTTYPANFTEFPNFTVSSASNITWGTKKKSIGECRVTYTLKNDSGTFINTPYYNTESGKYDKDPSGNATGPIRYFTKVNPGYYVKDRYLDTYCNPKSDGTASTNNMLFRDTYVCPAGSYCPGLTSMPKCTSGDYATTDQIGINSCATDTNGNYTLSAGGTSATSINACYLTLALGKSVETENAAPVSCPAGGYCQGGANIYYGSTGGFTGCGDGKYNDQTGQSAASACKAITAGCYGSSATTACPAYCAANSWSNSGAASCTACDSDYSNSGNSAAAHAGESSCKVTCAAGKVVETANAACTVPSGSWYSAQHTVAQGQTSAGLSKKLSCNSGYATANTTTQTDHDNSNDCKITCSAGKVVETANAACTVPSGSWYSAQHTVAQGQTSAGLSKKLSCNSGYATANTTTQTDHDNVNDCKITCAAGKYVAEENGACVDVGDGYYTTANQTIVQGSLGSRSACTALGSIYKNSDSGRDAKTDCYATTTSGNRIEDEAKVETTCPAGSYCEGGVKVYFSSAGGALTCPAGYVDGTTGYSSESQCLISCSAGTQVASANAACTTPQGTTWYTSQHDVTYGKTTSGMGKLGTCDSDYATANTTTAGDHDNVNDCKVTCAAGKVVATANEACTTPSGSWYSAQHVVSQGSTSGTNKKSCLTNYATANTTTVGDHDNVNDCKITCAAGKVVETANAACTVPSGSWYSAQHTVAQGQTSADLSKKLSCNSGYATANTTTQTDHDAVSDCKIGCSAGYYIPTAGKGCQLCPAGKYCEALSGIGQLTAKEPTGLVSGGYYSTGGGTSKTPTANGNGCVGSGKTCGKLSAKYYSNGGSIADGATCVSGQVCGECDADYLDNTATGKTVVTQCQQNCAAGTYVKSENEACVSVDVSGKFMSAHTVNQTATSTLESCPSGWDGSDAGATSNKSCYATCATSDKTITNGTITGVVNAKEYYTGSAYPACKYNASCSATYGLSGNGTSNPSCGLCSAGQYSAGGTATCTTCPGEYVDGAVAKSQAQCLLKTDATKYVATAAAGQVDCVAGNYCAGGTTVYYGTAGGTTTGGMTECPAGSYCPEKVSAATKCPGLYVNSTAGSDEAEDCHFTTTAGKYISSSTATAQTECDENSYCPATKLNYPDTGSKVACAAPYSKSAKGAKSREYCYLTTTAKNYVATAAAGQTACAAGDYCEGGATVYYGTAGGATTGGNKSCSANTNAKYTMSAASSSSIEQCYLMTPVGSYVKTEKEAPVTCDKGGYCSGGVQVYYNSKGGMTGCGAGKYNDLTGQSESSACKNITAGCYGTSATTACPAVCDANKWSNAGASSCTSCDSDYATSGTEATNHAGVTSCKVTCPAGKIVATANAACTVPSGSWYSAQHTVAQGQTSADLSKKLSCNSGYATANTTTQTDHDNSNDCKITCSAGTVVASAGAACSTPTGHWYSARHTVSQGSTSDSNKQFCATSYTTTNSTTQTDHDAETDCKITCEAGSYVKTARQACVSVDVSGKFMGEHTVEQSKNSTLESCPDGWDGSDGSRDSNKSCYAACATSDKTITNGTITGVVNAKEYYTGSAYPACKYNASCSATYGLSGNGTSNPSCGLCGAGQYSAGGTATCSTCPGEYVDGSAVANQAQCYLKTDAGKFVKATAAGQVTCEKGNFCAGGTTVYYGTAGGATTGGSATCPAGSFCPAESVTPTSCSTLGLYVNSEAGSEAEEDCFFTTTAGKYLAQGATALASCLPADYCPATKLNYPEVGGNLPCPDAATHKRTTYPASFTEFGNFVASEPKNVSWGEGKREITQCYVAEYFTNDSGTFSNYAYYNEDTQKYDTDVINEVNGVLTVRRFYTRLNPGYYVKDRYTDTYCNPKSDGSPSTNNMLFRDAVVCPAGSYCPGLTSMPKCTSGDYKTTDQIGINSCATDTGGNYTLSAGGTSATSINACYLTLALGKSVETENAAPVSCPAGGYCQGGANVYYGSTGGFTGCGDGKYNDQTGQSAASACKAITAGCYGSSATTDCPAYCAANSWSNSGAASCTACDSDYSNSGNSAAAHAGESSCKVTCAAGKVVDTPYAACTVPTGAWYSAEHVVSQGETSGANKQSCPTATQYADKVVSYNNNSHTDKTKCYARFEEPLANNSGELGYLNCYLGNATDYGTSSTSSCWTYPAQLSCSGGYYSPKNANSYGEMWFTNLNDALNNACVQVGAGYWSPADELTRNECPTGYVNGSATASAENQCKITVPAGNYVGNAGATYTACAKGYAKSTTETIAYGETTPVCTACVAGTYADATGMATCKNASAGYFVAGTAATSQTACAVGSYTNATGQTACIACGSAESKEESGEGTWGLTTSDVGQTSCNATCANATGARGWSDAVWNSNNTVDSLCEINACKGDSEVGMGDGHYLDAENNKCVLCNTFADGLYPHSSRGGVTKGREACFLYTSEIPGHYIDAEDMTVATPCPLATYSAGNEEKVVHYGETSTCDTCPDDTYADEEGLAACKSCLPNYTTKGGGKKEAASACRIYCSGGSYLKTANATECVPVGSGNWAVGGYVSQGSISDTLSACPAGLTTIGYGVGADEEGDCGRILNISGDKMYLRSDKKTQLALNVMLDGTVYYGNMSTADKFMSDGVNKKLKLNLNNVTYSVYDDSAENYVGDTGVDITLDPNMAATTLVPTSVREAPETWSATFSDGSVVSGKWGCSATTSTNGVLAADGFAPENAGPGCWCKITEPAEGNKWIYGSTLKTDALCSTNCSFLCANNMRGTSAKNITYRTNLYQSAGISVN